MSKIDPETRGFNDGEDGYACGSAMYQDKEKRKLYERGWNEGMSAYARRGPDERWSDAAGLRS